MKIIIILLLIVFISLQILLFRIVSNMWDAIIIKIKDLEKSIGDDFNATKQMVRNGNNITSSTYDNTNDITDINKCVNATKDSISTLTDIVVGLDERVEEHWNDYLADFSFIKDRLNSCKYKTKKPVKKLANTEKQDSGIKIGDNFNYTKTDN